jgi:hypothetical protein
MFTSLVRAAVLLLIPITMPVALAAELTVELTFKEALQIRRSTSVSRTCRSRAWTASASMVTS